MQKSQLYRATICALLTAAALPAIAQQPDQSTNLLAYSSGAWIIKAPAQYNDEWSAFWLLDERPATGWASPQGVVGPQELVLALPEQTTLTALDFDTASIDGDDEGSRGAKDLSIEVSDTSATAGYKAVAAITLARRKDRQRFAITTPMPGRWLRVTIKNNYGSADYIELMDIRGYGQQLTHSALPDFSGTYSTNYDTFRLAQNGSSVEGCYERSNGVLENGGVDGRVVRFTWVQEKEGGKKERGPAVIAFSPDGKSLFGLWWFDGDTDSPGNIWQGNKVSATTGACPHWKGRDSASAQLAKELADDGRVRLYGINFDTDSDVIKNESKPALDNVLKMAKEHATWNLTIEGHTDTTATAAHNQTLSTQRANAVKAYLIAGGITSNRLATVGYGSTKPVAENSTSMGRSQNRRVELVKN